ncbi:MAG TPA: hypothetical protein VEA59_01870 [Patescibacteria group bacterium]|nr:hypothetical protein [Patescibacteria group bacterium]
MNSNHFDPKNPDPWLALQVDSSIPLDADAKAAFIKNMHSRSRQFFLPIIQPFTKLAIILFQILKLLFPKSSAPRFMHRLIYLGLKYFVKPEANLLILRHFHIGSEVLAFLEKNIKGVSLTLNPLRPKSLEEIMPNLFVQHDINLYNFIIFLNQQLVDRGLQMEPEEKLDFSMITDGPFPIDALPRRPTNIIDVQTAIEIYTPIYQLLQSDDDFWRAANSLQLDETIGQYISKVLGSGTQLALVNNKHPLVPNSILHAGYNLVLHGLASETLHSLLRSLKRNNA